MGLKRLYPECVSVCVAVRKEMCVLKPNVRLFRKTLT